MRPASLITLGQHSMGVFSSFHPTYFIHYYSYSEQKSKEFNSLNHKLNWAFHLEILNEQ